jgi:hypothetical protein
MESELELEIAAENGIRRRIAIPDPAANSVTDDTEQTDWTYPEGGKEAWGCLLGAFVLMFPSFGFQTASK